MNDTATSASGTSLLPSSTDLFTGAHLAIIAVLIVLTVIAILYGAKLARRRHRAEHEIDRHNADVETAAPSPASPSPAVAPAPPPAVDQPAPGTPPMPVEAGADSPGVQAGDGPVTQLKGLGPKVAARLAELGITTIGQIATLDDAAAARLDDDLGAFKGRMARDRWVEQARLLAAGDQAGFEAAFGRL